MELANGPMTQRRDRGALQDRAHDLRLFSVGLDAADRQVRLERTFLFLIAEAGRELLDVSLKPAQGIQLPVDSYPDNPRIFHVRKTTRAFERKLKGRDARRGALQAGGEIGQVMPGDMAEEFEREVELFRLGPAHRVARYSGLELSLNLFQFDRQAGFQRNRDERPNKTCRACSHRQRIRPVPAG